MFQLTKDECLTSQIVTLNESRGHLPTVAKFATVQKEGNRIVTRYVEYYNLDVIISVGIPYRSITQRPRQKAIRLLQDGGNDRLRIISRTIIICGVITKLFYL